MKTYRHALIIDDDTDLCLLLKVILNTSIPDVKLAHSIESGEKLLKHSRPDVIFLDNSLPDGQGLNYIKEIKSISPESRLIIITANDNTRDEAMLNGADFFLDKPLTPAKIQEALNLDLMQKS